MRGSRFTITALSAALLLPAAPPPATTDSAAVRFTDVTASSGVKFTHNAGRTGKRWLPETMGAGCAWIDVDGDGWLDILLVNGKDLVPKGRRTTAALYRNNRNGTFTDITKGSGLDVELYGFGASVGDYDNDGKDDVYLTALGGDRLFHNEGGGRFRDVTAQSGLTNKAFASSAAWLDYDRDGKLDLFVANYVQWEAQHDVWCSLDGATKSYCTPESYKGTPSRLYHGLGGGRFEDVTNASGIADPNGKSLGVAVFDYNGDGWPDLFVANDTQPNKLYRNLQNGKFKEEGLAAGVAFGEDGVARGAMGVDAADYDRSDRQHLIVGNFANQMLGLYHNEGNGLFVDEAPRSTVGRASLLSLTFGLFFFDYDLDGNLDLFAANGHIEEEIGRVQAKVQYAQLPLLFRNAGKGKFEPVSAFTRPLVARGAAYADFDHDGDLDILITTNNGPAVLYRNDGANRNHWLTLRLSGSKSNRNGIGAVVKVGGQQLTVHSGSSYCSSSDLALTFGLGSAATPVTVDILWPSGTKQQLTNVKPDQLLNVTEP